MDLLAENNECGQALLRLVSKGNAIIYELFSLKHDIPPIYGLHPSKAEASRYGLLLNLDFQYFQSPEKNEDLIQANEALSDLDDSLKGSYTKVFTKFYTFFDSILSYVNDLKAFISECQSGAYLQVSLESLMIDAVGKQLLAEALYLLGVILLLTDELIPGPVREKLLVAHVRYIGGHTESIDNVCKILRSTGYIHENGKRPSDYPEFLFKRADIPESFINIVLARLRLDDIYNQMSSFPEHRSVALASQGSMTVICLFFAPQILKQDSLSMREIVDKFFFDNWVTTYYMGNVINLAQIWEPYPAAKSALSNTIQTPFIREIAKRKSESLKKLVTECSELTKDGVLTEEVLMDTSVQILDLVRRCNYVLRWIMLHTYPLQSSPNKRSRQLRDEVMLELEDKKYATFTLLLNTASLELKLRQIHQNLISKREEKWAFCRDECESRMSELSKVFGGELKLSRVSLNSKLEKWFSERKDEISSLDLDQPLKSGRLATQLIRALKESVELGQMESNLQVKEYVLDSIDYLKQIVRYASIKDEFLMVLQLISDFQYGWNILESFTPLIQKEVIRDPSIVKRLRAIFIKISSVIETPILRVSQLGEDSKELNVMSKYYSAEIVRFIQNVLQVIPKTIFELLTKVQGTTGGKEFDMPSRLDKDKIKSYARLDDRYEIARLTHNISTFAEGMMSMNYTLIGIIRVDAKRLLIEGMRKELVQRVCTFCGKLFSTNSKSKVPNVLLLDRISDLKKFSLSLSQSFEYVQDYINVPGLSIWQEEMSRIINFCVETESNLFLKHKVPPTESVYQSKTVPITLDPLSGDAKGLTFIGCLAEDLLSVIDPFQTVYIKRKQKWYDSRTKNEVCSLSLFASLSSTLGSYGMSGLDKLIGLKAVVCLQDMTSRLGKNNPCMKEWIPHIKSLEDSHRSKSFESLRQLKNSLNSKGSKSFLAPLIQAFSNLGRYQVIRYQIAYQLRLQCSFNSKPFFLAIKNLNETLVEEEKRRINGDTSLRISSESPLLYKFGTYLQWSGLLDPLKAIYIMPENINHIPEFIFCLIVSTSPRLSLIDGVGKAPIIRKAGDHIDGSIFVLGLSCFLRQFPVEFSQRVFHYLVIYLTSQIRSAGTIQQEILVIKVILRLLLRETGLDKILQPMKLLEHCLLQL